MITPGQVPSALVAASATTYYPLDSKLKKGIIKQLVFNNIDTVAHTVTAYLVPAAGSASTTNQCGETLSLAAGRSMTCYAALLQTMNPGETIQAVADAANKVSIRGSVAEYSS